MHRNRQIRTINPRDLKVIELRNKYNPRIRIINYFNGDKETGIRLIKDTRDFITEANTEKTRLIKSVSIHEDGNHIPIYTHCLTGDTFKVPDGIFDSITEMLDGNWCKYDGNYIIKISSDKIAFLRWCKESQSKIDRVPYIESHIARTINDYANSLTEIFRWNKKDHAKAWSFKFMHNLKVYV